MAKATGGGATGGGGGGGGIIKDGGITFIAATTTFASPSAVSGISIVEPIISTMPIYQNLNLGGTDASETLLGGMGNDTLDGGLGDDLEIGGSGSDRLTSSAGIDTLAGGTGDDVYVIDGGEAHIEDFQGHDTIDVSAATGNSYVDLSGDSVSHVQDHDVYITGGGTTAQKLDVQFLQDLTGSFADDIANVRTLIPNIVSTLQGVQPDALFGVSSFRDKPLGFFGGAGDYVYSTDVALTTNAAAVTNAYNAMVATGGADGPESQIESLMHLALNTGEVGFRPDSARFVVLFTDAPFHVGGDGLSAGVSTTANNGDAVIDLLEDYPMIAQLKSALENANIIPVFAVTADVVTIYQDLVTQLGRGTVVTITADSANVVDAVSAGMVAATTTYIEDAVGGAGDDTLLGSGVANSLYGGAGNDTLDGKGGNDKLIGGDGIDTAVYHGAQADYDVTMLVDGTYQVTDLRAGSADGKDILSGVEKLSFSDGTIDLTPTDPALVAASEAAALAAAQAAADAAANAAALAAAKAAADTASINAQAAANAATTNANALHSLLVQATNYANDASAMASYAAANATTATMDLAAAQAAAADAAIQAKAAAAALAVVTTDVANADAAATAATNAAKAAAAAATIGDATAAVAAKDAAMSQLDVIKTAAADATTQLNLAYTADVGATNDAQKVADIVSSTPLNIVGTAGSDYLAGATGNDTIDGLGGSDTMVGGKGNDTYIVESAGDTIIENANEGIDSVITTASYVLSANIENITISSSASGKDATGNDLSNIIIGNNSNNILNGMAGEDLITGGGGTDTLTGGIGNDIFKFIALTDSQVGAKHDIITDFSAGDKIDLSQIDAISSTNTVNDAFTFIGTGAFTKVAGQLQFDAVNHNLSGDVNGDGKADFEINLLGVSSLTSADIVL